MTQINQNFDTNVSNGRIVPQQKMPVPVIPPRQTRIPDYYKLPEDWDKKSIKESLEENPLTMMPYMFVKPLVEHPIASIGTWLGLSYMLNQYDNACSGEYSKSLHAKAANLGDRIQNSKFIQSKPVQNIIHGLTSASEKGGKIANKSSIIRAVNTTPTMPEWGMVKSEMSKHAQKVVYDFLHITDILKLTDSTGHPELNDLAVNSKEKEMLKKVFNTSDISKIKEADAVNQILLYRLGRSQKEIDLIINSANANALTKAEMLKEMGITAEELRLIKADETGKYIKEVKAAAGKAGGKVKVGLAKYGFLGPLSKPFERTLGCDNVYNRLHSISEGAKTATGRFLAKIMQMAHRGFTFGGGKIGVLVFIAPALVESAINVSKADKNQKVGTGVGSFINQISWVFTFPLGLKIMHSFGGIKYSGMTKDKVEECRKILEEFLKLGMLKKDGETFIIKNWEKYQSIDKYENYQIQNRERQKRYREKLKNEIEKSNVIVTLNNTEEEKRTEKNTKEIRKEDITRKEDENGFREYKL